MGIEPLTTGEVDALVTRVQALQQQMLAASLAGDQATVDRLAVLLRTEVRRVMGVSEWMARVLVEGWTTELPTTIHRLEGSRL